MSATLKPCAHCGGKAELLGFKAPEFWVACPAIGCKASTEAFGSKERAIAAWNRRADGWQDMDTAPQDGTPFIAVRRWPSGSVDTEVYRWEGAPDFWIDSRRHTCIRPDYQEHYRWFPLPGFASEAS